MTTTLAAAPVAREKRFTVRGVNDDQSFCMCCGKDGLKRVVWIEDLETQEVRHFGTTCATAPGKAFGLTKEIEKAVRGFDKAKLEAALNAHWALVKAETDKALSQKTALYLERGGTYREHTALNGHKFMIPADSALMDSCHADTIGKLQFPRPPRA